MRTDTMYLVSIEGNRIKERHVLLSEEIIS